MVVIRLARRGTKHSPRYRVTVADQRFAATGRYLEVIGNFNPFPRNEEKSFQIDMDRFNNWVKKGAQPTKRVKSLIRKLG